MGVSPRISSFPRLVSLLLSGFRPHRSASRAVKVRNRAYANLSNQNRHFREIVMVAAYRTRTQSQQPKQDDVFLDPGFVLDPFEPLYLSGEPTEYSQEFDRLYGWWKEIDAIGGKRDFENKLDELVWEVEGSVLGWYKSALSLWKIKLTKAWEASERVLGKKVSSFKEFCEKVFGRTVSSVNSWIRAARTMSLLLAANFARLPKVQSIALELSKFSDESAIDLWRDLTDRYADHEISVQKMKEHLADPSKPKYKQVRIDLDALEILQELAADADMSPSRYLTQLVKGLKKDDPSPEIRKEFTEISQEKPVATGDETLFVESPDNLVETPKRNDLHHDDPDSQSGHGDGDVSESLERPEIKRSKPVGFGESVGNSPATKKKSTPIAYDLRSDATTREEVAASRLKRALDEFRANPLKNTAPNAPPFECTTCKATEKLIACFNLANFGKTADRYYCEQHIEDSGYCHCGRWHSQCNCEDLDLEF